MHDYEKTFVDIDALNKRNLYLVLGIMMVIDSLYLVLSLFHPEYIAFANPASYVKWMPVFLLCDLILLMWNYFATSKSRYLLEVVFLFTLTVSRILFVDYIEMQSFAIVPYVSLFLICSAAFLYESQLFIAGAFSQLVLFSLLWKHQSAASFTILAITTLLFLFSASYSRDRKKLTLLYNQSLADQKVQRESLNNLLSVMDVIVILLDPRGVVTYYNKAFTILTGYSGDYGSTLDEYFKFSDLQGLERCFNQTLQSGQPCLVDSYELHDFRGRIYHFSVKMNRVQFGRLEQVMVTAYDLSKENRLSKVKDLALELNNMLAEYHQIDDYLNHILTKLVSAIPYAKLGSVLVLDQDGFMYMKANVGYDQGPATSFKLNLQESFFYRMSSGKRDQPIIINNLGQFSMNGITPILTNIYGQEVISSISSPIMISGELKGLINLDAFEDEVFTPDDIDIMAFLVDQVAIVLSAHQLKEQVMSYMRYDQLTGLYNRWKLKEIESDVILHCLRHDLSFVLVMIDINNLKLVNDNYGHANGDFYIKAFAELLKQHARETDLVIRIGGDEFVAVYFESDAASIQEKMEVISQALKEKTSAFAKNGITCGIAYGLVSFPEEAVTMDQLLSISDERMYVLKRKMKGVITSTDHEVL